MNQRQSIERDCAAFDGWLVKAELLLGRSEGAEHDVDSAVASQALVDSYEVRRECDRKA